MGMDGVELIMALEEQFGIEIENETAEGLVTPVKVIDYICTKLQMTDEKRCQSQRAFYLLRRALVQKSGRRRSEITPKTKLRDLFRETDCTEQWLDLKKSVDARGWPRLSRPVWMQNAMLAGSVASWAAMIFLFHRMNLGVANEVMLGFLAALVAGSALSAATRSFIYAIPRRIVTVADLVPYAESSNAIQWTREDIARKVREIVIEQLGIKESEYREDAHFINDLGLG